MSKEIQKKLQELQDKLKELEQQGQIHVENYNLSIPLPRPIHLDGDIAENFKHFKRSWDNYIIASGLQTKPEKQKIAILLSAIGEEVFKRYPNFDIKDNEKEVCSTLLDAIGKNLSPKVNIRYERAVFNMAKQNDEENYSDYFNRLKSLIKNCQYGSLEKDLLLDKIIYSIKDVKLRETLWLNRDITLKNAIDCCKSKELSEMQLKNISNDEVQEVNKIRNGNKTFSNQNNFQRINRSGFSTREETRKFISIDQCKYCGYSHQIGMQNCPAQKALCKFCNRKGHFAKVCFQRLKQVQEVKIICEKRDEEQYDENVVLMIESKKNEDLTTELIFKSGDLQKKISCQLDTGATCCIMGYRELCLITEDNNPKLDKSDSKLKCFGGQIIYPVGRKIFECIKNNHTYKVLFEVVDYNHKPLLSANACNKLNLIKVCNKVSKLSDEAMEIINNYQDVFEGLGQIKGSVSLEIDEKMKPTIQQPRRIPVPLKNELKKMLDELEKDKIITKEEGYTKWTSNIVLVRKSNNKLRLCIDPIKVNQALKNYKYQIPTLEESMPDLANAKIFTTLDVKNGFWHVKLDEDGSKLTSFWTPFGKYRWLRLPFGLKPSMEIFEMKLHGVIQGLEGVICIADDLLVYGCGNTEKEAIADHNTKLENLLERLREENVKLNKDKMKLCQKSVKFFGHLLTSEGVKADEAKINAIKNLTAPKTKMEVMKFLGMVNYLGKYIPQLAKISEPLRNLTHLKINFVWLDKHEEAFKRIKELISKETILKYFDPTKSVTIQTDSSSFAIGCTLMQENQPVGYASKMLSTSQTKYCQLEKEMLAILYACRKFDQYICGKNDVLIQTDHKPIIDIFKKPLIDAPKRLQSMILQLHRYNLKITYIKGSEMYIADVLSRLPGENNEHMESFDVYNIENVFQEIENINSLENISITDKTYREIKEETIKDECMRELYRTIQSGWPDKIQGISDLIRPYWKFREELHTQHGMIFKRDRIVIPEVLRRKIMDKLHYSHQGIEYTINLAKGRVFWPSITVQIKEKVQNCDICMKFSRNQQNPPMLSHETAKYPFEIVSMDVFETKLNERNKRFLIIVDHYSDFFFVEELKDMEAKTTILQCKKIFSTHGIPRKIISDNGTNFYNKEFRNFAKDWNFEHYTSSPNHSQGNGKAEATVKIAKQMIKKGLESENDFYEMILIERNTPNKIGYSPAQRLFSRNLRCTVPIKEACLQPKVPKEVRKNIDEQKQKTKNYYDRKTTILRYPKQNEEVVFRKNKNDKQWTKGYIENEVTPRSCTIRAEGKYFRRNLVDIKSRPQITEDFEYENRNSEINENANNHNHHLPVYENGIKEKRIRKCPIKFSDYHLYK